MIVLRPAKMDDLEGLYELSSHAKTGLTTLPCDKDILREKIKDSVKSFKFPPTKPSGESFLFLLEDTEKQKVIGTSAIFNKVGGFDPFWTYEIKTKIIESKVVNVKKEIQFLQLKGEHSGPSEIGTLFLLPEYRKGNNGRMLSLSRFMFIAQYPTIFENKVLAEMRGVFDDNGDSVFWEAIGAHFFDIPFEKADYMVTKDKTFIDDLMPKHPIYIPLLPKEAQMVIGQVHEDTRPAIRLLEQEGFKKIPEIDIFEAGPVVQAEQKDIRTIKESRLLNIHPADQIAQSRVYMIANISSLENFKVCYANLEIKDDKVYVLEETLKALDCSANDKVRISPIRTEEKR